MSYQNDSYAIEAYYDRLRVQQEQEEELLTEELEREYNDVQ